MVFQERYWLVKSEPDCFSIQDLADSPKQTTSWDGVRNYQARNFLLEMRIGDLVLFHHSSADPPALAGIARVVREAHPDPTSWDPKSDHHDPKAGPDNPVWQMVDLKLLEIFHKPIGLAELRKIPALAKMELLRRGSRLSVQPVTAEEFAAITKSADAASPRKAKRRKPAGSNISIRNPATRPRRPRADRLACPSRNEWLTRPMNRSLGSSRNWRSGNPRDCAVDR